MRVAHRGGAGLAPENTLAAFANALDLGVDALELDVHLSRDGVLMVMHDPLLKATTGMPGAIADYDAAPLRAFDAAANYTGAKAYGEQSIPTLEEVVALVDNKAGGPVWMQIEIKMKSDGARYEGIEEKLINTLRDHRRIDSTMVISFDFPSLAKVYELEPRVRRAALIGKKYMAGIGAGGPKAVAREMASLGVDCVGVDYQYLSQSLYNELRAKKLGIGVWTVNDPSVMQRLAAMGVDFITTDRPDVLMATING